MFQRRHVRRDTAGLPALAILVLTLAAPAEAQQSTDGLAPSGPAGRSFAPAAGDATAADQNELLRVPVSGLVPGAISVRPNIKNPEADPAAAQRGMKAFIAFNCVGCHMGNGGGGMGPAL